MFKKLTLKNFQAHENTVIDFAPGVNVIVGRSDRGKSSIIRALQLLFFNRPGGKAYIRHGAKECRVEAEMASGQIVKRLRTKSKNEYQVGANPALKAPGRDVPPEVMEICPMQEINFQGQHDSPFMLAETAGECGRMLNKCVDLTIIDRTLNDLNTKKRNATGKLQHSVEAISEQREEITRYKTVPAMILDSKSLAVLLSSCVDLEEKLTSLATAVDSFERLTADLKALPNPAEGLEALTALETTVRQEAKDKAHLAELQDSIELVAETEGDLRDMAESEKHLKAELDEIMGETCPLCGQATGGIE